MHEPRPVTLPTLAAIAGGVYLAWLHFGTRENPPIPYDRFRTGLTFAAVRELLSREQEAAYDAGQYMFVSRSTVLGRMHQLKREQYARYLEAYEDDDEGLPF